MMTDQSTVKPIILAVGSCNPVKLNSALEGIKKAADRDVIAEGD